jgi:hypothetical protein
VITAAPVSPRSTLAADVVGGVTTFFTMAYIVVVNPAILATAGTGMTFSGVLTATVLVAATMTLLMGLYARLPFAVAPGMGLNAFFAYTIVLQNKVVVAGGARDGVLGRRALPARIGDALCASASRWRSLRPSGQAPPRESVCC